MCFSVISVIYTPITIRQQTHACKLVEIYPRVLNFIVYIRYLSPVWWLFARCQAKRAYNRVYHRWSFERVCNNTGLSWEICASCCIESYCDYYDWISRDRRWSASLIEPRRLAMKVSWENCEIPEFTRSREDPDRSGRFLELVKRHGDWPGRQGISQVLILIYFTSNQNTVLINIIIIKCLSWELYKWKKLQIIYLLSLYFFFYIFHLLFLSIRVLWILFTPINSK